jgi:hypothetical protein
MQRHQFYDPFLSKLSTLLLIVIMSACGGGSSSPPPTPVRPQKVSDYQVSAQFASVARIKLERLKLPSTLTAAQVTMDPEVGSDVAIEDGEIRFIVPGDNGEPRKGNLKIALADHDLIIPIGELDTSRPNSIDPYYESCKDDCGDSKPIDPDKIPPLQIKGIGANNVLQNEKWTFSVPNVTDLSLKNSGLRISFKDPEGSFKSLDFSSYLVHDPDTKGLAVPANKVNEILQKLPIGDVGIEFQGVNADDSFNQVWSYRAYKPGIVLKGQVLSPDGIPITSLKGRKMAILPIGQGSQTVRQVTTIDDQGRFVFENLLPDQYWVELLDTKSPDWWKTSVSIYPGSTLVELPFKYVPLEPPQAANSGSFEQTPSVQPLHAKPNSNSQ